MIASGYSENVDVDEGFDPATGIRTIVKFEGSEIIIQRQWDPKPYLLHVQEMRERNEGKNWGEGKEVGYIPPAFRGKISIIKDRKDREKAIKQFFRDNPAFCAFPKFLK